MTGVFGVPRAVVIDFADVEATCTFMAREHHHKIVKACMMHLQESFARTQFTY
jgi:hypothetical protein